MDNNQSLTWFDRFPIEILLNIFDYLSNNDIIYAFFNLNQRLNCLVLKHERYLMNFEQPTRNLDFWRNILSIIGIHTKCLYITSHDLSIPLNIFPNLKSIEISSSFPYDNHSLSSIIESEQFNKLESLKIESNFCLQQSSFNHREYMEKILFEKIFTNENSLQIFEYSPNASIISFERIVLNLTFNFHIQSLSLKKFPLNLALSIIEYAPNLKYFNIIATTFEIERDFMRTTTLSNIQLKKLYLTLDNNTKQSYSHDEFITLTDVIKKFSSSLICLSIDVSNYENDRRDDILFNGIELEQQLLRSLVELKQFHFKAKFSQDWNDVENILSRFSNQFWFDHHWAVGTHANYLYTLPYHFDKLNDFIDFENVKSSNSDILNNNSRIWYHVKSIELSKFNIFNSNFIKQLKIKIPKLILIKVNSDYLTDTNDTTENEILYTVTTIHQSGSIDNFKPWFIKILPNLKYLSLLHSELSFSINQLAPILTKKIERLNILTTSTLEPLIKMSNVYFSNVKHIQLTICFKFKKSEIYANEVKRILTCFKNLNQLSINMYGRGNWPEIEMTTMLKYLNTKDIQRNYQIKHYHDYILFLKRTHYV